MTYTSTLKHLKRSLTATLFAAPFLINHNGLAQLSYAMVPSTPGYTILSGGTSISDLSAGSDQTISSAIPIGFDFTFDGTIYTECQASDNGYLHFGNELAPTGYGNASGDLIIPNDFSDANASDGVMNTTRPFVAPLWEELAIAGIGGGGNTSYLTEGVAPNRTFTIEWNKVSWRAPTSTDQISFQVVLHETTNVIDFIYMQGAVALGTNPSASIGLAGKNAGDFYSLSDSGPNPTASKTVNTMDIATKPATGQMYSWMPAIPTTINDRKSQQSISSVYFDPNSNHLKVSVDMKEAGNYDFEVVDITGRSVYNDKMNITKKGKSDFEFALPACTSGIYIAKISGQNNSAQLKFIKD